MFSREAQAAFKGEAEDGRQTAMGGTRNVTREVAKAAGGGGYDQNSWAKGAGFNLDQTMTQAGMQKRGENRDFATYGNPKTGAHVTIHKASERFMYDDMKNPPKSGYVEDLGNVVKSAAPNGQQQNNQNGGQQLGPDGNPVNNGSPQAGPDTGKVHSAVENQDGSFSVIQSHDSKDKANASPAGTHVLQASKDGQWQATPKGGGMAVQVDSSQIHTPKAATKPAPKPAQKSDGGTSLSPMLRAITDAASTMGKDRTDRGL